MSQKARCIAFFDLPIEMPHYRNKTTTTDSFSAGVHPANHQFESGAGCRAQSEEHLSVGRHRHHW